MRWNFKNKKIFIVVATGAGAASLFFFVYKPLYEKAREHKLVYALLEKENAAARELIARLKEQNKEKHFMPESDFSRAVDEITAAGSRLGIRFKSITPSAAAASDDPPSLILPISLEVEAPYEQCARFLGDLRELPNALVSVAEFNLQPAAEDASFIVTRIKLNLYLARKP